MTIKNNTILFWVKKFSFALLAFRRILKIVFFDICLIYQIFSTLVVRNQFNALHQARFCDFAMLFVRHYSIY